MKKTLFLLLLLQLTTLSLWAKSGCEHPTPKYPSDANIVGHVVDASSGEHLPGITIQIKGTAIGAVTDGSGHYFLRNLKPGEVTLQMRAVGYHSQEKIVRVEKDKTIEINFEAKADQISLEAVVVSANRETTLRRLAPTLVTVVNEKLFQRVNAANLAQGLVFQPGVRVEDNCQNCGFNQVRINGLDGRYSQILIDSRPVMSALAGVYGLEQIPANMIDRVEVVRGGGSALFGSSAIAGVINIITKEPVRNAASFSESLGFSGMKGLDNQMSFNASLVTDDQTAGAMVFGQARHRNAWDANGDGFSELNKIDTRSMGAHLFLRPNASHKVTAEVHTIQEFRRGGDHLDLPAHAAAVAEQIDHSIYSGNIKYDFFSTDYKHHLQGFASAQLIHRKSYYGGIGELEVEGKPVGINNPLPDSLYGKNYGNTRGRTYNGGLQYTYDFDKLFFMPAQILIGAELTHDVLRDDMPLRQWEAVRHEDGTLALDPDGLPLSMFPTLNQRITNWSQLAQLEWKNEQLSILLGARLDEHSALSLPAFNPRVTLRYNPTKNMSIRASYAKGFRAPQVFDEDLHVGVVGGEAQRVINHKDLRAETSHALSLSTDMYFDFGDVYTNLMVEGFYTRLQDAFVLQELPSINDGIKRFERTNGSGAKVYGTNIEAKAAYKWLQIQAGMTLASAMYDQEEEWGERTLTTEMNGSTLFVLDDQGNYLNEAATDRHILRTPNVYGYFTAALNPHRPLTISLSGTFTGRMYSPHAIEYGAHAAHGENNEPTAPDASGSAPRIDELKHTPSFFDFGFKVSYDFKPLRSVDLQLFAGINNVFDAYQSDFDRGAARDSGYIYGPTSPRTGYIGLRLNF